jgi:hypothetical protein
MSSEFLEIHNNGAWQYLRSASMLGKLQTERKSHLSRWFPWQVASRILIRSMTAVLA